MGLYFAYWLNAFPAQGPSGAEEFVEIMVYYV